MRDWTQYSRRKQWWFRLTYQSKLTLLASIYRTAFVFFSTSQFYLPCVREEHNTPLLLKKDIMQPALPITSSILLWEIPEGCAMCRQGSVKNRLKSCENSPVIHTSSLSLLSASSKHPIIIECLYQTISVRRFAPRCKQPHHEATPLPHLQINATNFKSLISNFKYKFLFLALERKTWNFVVLSLNELTEKVSIEDYFRERKWNL